MEVEKIEKKYIPAVNIIFPVLLKKTEKQKKKVHSFFLLIPPLPTPLYQHYNSDFYPSTELEFVNNFLDIVC